MVASKEILLEAQEIKRRLLSKGEHAEETVICELLESLDSDFKGNKIEHIINMITDNQDFDDDQEFDQKYEDQAGPSHVDTTYSFSDTQNSIDFKTCEDLSQLSSESDDDRDFYYSNNSDTVEIIDEEVSNSSSPPASPVLPILSSSPLVPSSDLPVSSQEETTNNNKAEIANNNTSNEIEMEENNNDVCVTSVCETKRETESPKPGCSKDMIDDTSSKVDDFCNTCNLEDLQKDAKQIHNILPSYDYSLIYETLLKNQNVINRIELALWDLLPEERPVAKILCSKEKSLDKVDSDNSDETKVTADTVSVPVAEKSTRVDDINNVTSEITKLKQRVNILKEKYNTKRMLQDQGPDSTKTTHKRFRCTGNDPHILRPAKLIFDNPIPMPAPLDKQQQLFLPTSLPSLSVSQPVSLSHISLLPQPEQTLMPSSSEGKSKQVLSPPKLHLPKQPDHVTSTSANTSKACVAINGINNTFFSHFKKNILNVIEKKQLAAATASNKTRCETREDIIWRPYSMENAHLPSKNELSEKILNLKTIPRSLKLSPPNRKKDMPILNASHSFNDNNEMHQKESDVEVLHISSTKDKVSTRCMFICVSYPYNQVSVKV